nr:prepilin peptidase [Actinomycetales bacterium]
MTSRRGILLALVLALAFGIGGALAGGPSTAGGRASPASLTLSWWHLIPGLVLGACLGVLADIDIRSHRLPDRIQYPLLGGLAAHILLVRPFGVHGLWSALAGAIGVALVFLVLAVVAAGGLGLGDVKLGAILGLWTGWLHPTGPVVFVMAAFLVGGLYALVLMALKKATRTSHIPFGPFLIAGAAIATWWTLL